MSQMSQTRQAIKFEKVLWRKQPFQDNFVATTFLSDLRTNSQLVLPEWFELVVASLRVSGRFLRVVLFSLLFVHLRLASFHRDLLLFFTLFAFVVLFSLVSSPHAVRGHGNSPKRGSNKAVGRVLSNVIMGLVLLAVSPVLRTLTESTTSDSIWALAAILFSIHLTLADYANPNPKHAKNLSDTLSFNAAISASVLLASRLNTNWDTFTLLTLAMLLFAPSTPNNPLITVDNTQTNTMINFATLYSITMAIGFCFTVTSGREWIWLVLGWTNVVVGFISIVCPWWIRMAQRWKMEIKGPWDPAEPILSSSLHS